MESRAANFVIFLTKSLLAAIIRDSVQMRGVPSRRPMTPGLLLAGESTGNLIGNPFFAFPPFDAPIASRFNSPMIIALDARPLVRRQIAGTEQRARNILSAWAAAPANSEHQFHLLFPRPDNPKDPAFDDALIKSLPENFHPLDISSFKFPADYHMGARVLNALARAVNRIKADVYHSFSPDVPRIGCPVVPTIHDLSFELDPNVRRTAAGRRLHHITAQSVQYASRLIAISSQTKHDIASFYRLPLDHIDVVYNAIDPVFAPLSATEIPKLQPIHLANNIQPPYVLAVGADIPRRNYDRMLAAMKIVWNPAPPPPVSSRGLSPVPSSSANNRDAARTKWVLAGRDDWEHSNIYAAAKAAGVLDRMRFVRAPSNSELVDLYRGATLTCCASSFEGFGLSVLESIACGTAVACSDMRSLREVAEDAALYFPHDDPEAMGEAIAGLLEDAEYRRQLKYRGLHRASLFTWQTAAQLTLASLTAAIDPK